LQKEQRNCYEAWHALQSYDVKNHKGYLIYGGAKPVEGKRRWYAVGIVYSPEFPDYVRELHRFETHPRLEFETKERATEHALDAPQGLCGI
jgi:hypothetical protein